MSDLEKAVQIAEDALRGVDQLAQGRRYRAELVLAALSDSGWLHDPAVVAALRELVAPARALTVDKDDDDALLELGGALAALDEGPGYCMSPVGTFSGSAPEMCALVDGHDGRCRA